MLTIQELMELQESYDSKKHFYTVIKDIYGREYEVQLFDKLGWGIRPYRSVKFDFFLPKDTEYILSNYYINDVDLYQRLLDAVKVKAVYHKKALESIESKLGKEEIAKACDEWGRFGKSLSLIVNKELKKKKFTILDGGK